jgi:integrase
MKLKRVYAKHGAWWFVDVARKWHRLGPLSMPEGEILAKLTQAKTGATADTAMTAIFARYDAEIMPRKAPRTLSEQRKQLARLRAAFRAFHSPAQVKRKHVAQYLDAHPARVVANREISLLSHIFTKAIRWGLAESNPCTGVERNTEKARRHYASDWDFWLAWAMAGESLRILLELLYVTGQRPSDVLKIRQSHVGPDGLYFEQGKTGKEITIQWSPRLRQIVAWARSRQTVTGLWLLADGHGQPYTYGAMAQQFGKLMRTFPGERFQLRDVRRKSGTDHPTGDHLGHADKRVRDRVYRVKPESQPGIS